MMDLNKYYGITVTNIWDNGLEAKLARLKPPKPIVARIVVDPLTDYTPYVAAFQMVSKYAIPMLQVCDSFLDGQLTDAQYNVREQWMLANLQPYAPLVEITNEIGPNVNWTSPTQMQRAINSSKLWVRQEMVVTYFWPGPDYSLADFILWVNSNKIEAEHYMLSFYPTKMADFRLLDGYFKAGMMGLSECGMEQWVGAYTKPTKTQVKNYAYGLGPPVFWWDWQTGDSDVK